MVSIRHQRLRKQLSGDLTIGRGERILKCMLNQTTIDQVFHALGDPTRRRLVERLSRGSASVSDLARPLGITLAAVVQHLQVLERSGVVRTHKVGRVRTCHIEPTGLNLAADWIAERRLLWERRLDRLGDILAEEERPTRRATKKRAKS
jgi:DNA-binding transcriptional ArsR family regulator